MSFSKKKLSDLIMSGGEKRYSAEKIYIPATKLTTPLGKKFTRTNVVDLQPKINYKKEYEDLLYKKLYKQIKPHPKDIHEKPELYNDILEQQLSMLFPMGKPPAPPTAPATAPLTGFIPSTPPLPRPVPISPRGRAKHTTKSGRSSLSSLSYLSDPSSGYDSSIYPSRSKSTLGSNYSSARTARSSDFDHVNPVSDIYNSDFGIDSNELDLYGTEDEPYVQPIYSQENEDIDIDKQELDKEYNTNISNYAPLTKPVLAYLPQPQESIIASPIEEESSDYETITFKDISPTQVDNYIKKNLPHIPKEDRDDLFSMAESNAELLKFLKSYKSFENPRVRETTKINKKGETEYKKYSNIANTQGNITKKIQKKYNTKLGKQNLFDTYLQKDIFKLAKEKALSTKERREGTKLSEKYYAPQEYTGKGLKKKRNSGGKISVGNLTKFFKSSYAKKAPEKIDTYNLDKDISNQYGTVYYDPNKSHAVITHRGTKGVSDWANNAAYAMGLYKYTPRYKEGKKLQEATEHKYGSENVSTLGHSQGSHLAREHGQNSKEIINLNPAYKGEKPLPNEYNIRSSGDVVSVGLHGTTRGHDTLIKSESYNPLTEHGIDILNRLDQEKMIGGRKIIKLKRAY